LVISKVRLMIVIPNHTRLGQRQGEFPKADHYLGVQIGRT